MKDGQCTSTHHEYLLMDVIALFAVCATCYHSSVYSLPWKWLLLCTYYWSPSKCHIHRTLGHLILSIAM